MSEHSDTAKKTAATLGNTGTFAPRDRGAQFVAASLEPDDTHKQLVLEAIEQMFAANAQALYLDPASDSFRLSLGTPEGISELGVLPLPMGRIMVETIRRESVLTPASGGSKFLDGVLRVEYAKAERRLRVHLLTTAHGLSAVLKLIPSLPAASGDLKAMGLAPAQEAIVGELLSKGSGLILLGGPDSEWVSNTLSTCLGYATRAGRRAALLTAEPGADNAGVSRIEIGFESAEQAKAIPKIADAGMSCFALEKIISPETARAAALAALNHKAVVLITMNSRGAPEALSQFMSLGIEGPLAATVRVALYQIQIPLLCPACARWGEIPKDDLRFFGINLTNKANFYVRNGCPKCNGQILEFAQIFELLSLTDTVRNSLRADIPYASLEAGLLAAPGYVSILQMVIEAAKAGRCSLSEAHQFLSWQLPEVPVAVK